MPTDISCQCLGFKLKSPLVLASGIIGTSADLLERAARCGAGAVTSKSCSLEPRLGHPNPIAVEWAGGVINAVGLTNPGADEEVQMLLEAKARLAPLGVPLIASIFASSVEQFGQVAAIISQAQPDLIEVNISCPNVGDEFGTPFAGSIRISRSGNRKSKGIHPNTGLHKTCPQCTQHRPHCPGSGQGGCRCDHRDQYHARDDH